MSFFVCLFFNAIFLAAGKSPSFSTIQPSWPFLWSTRLEEVYHYRIVFQILQRESWMEAVRVQAKVHARMPTQSVPAPQPRNVPVKAGIRPLVARVVSFSFFCVTPAAYRFYQYCSP